MSVLRHHPLDDRPPAQPAPPSLDGRSLRGDDGVTFSYREFPDLVEATYEGGGVRRGHRLGTREGNHLRLQWAEVLDSGESRAGRVDARVETLPDGRLRLHELWVVQGPGRAGHLDEGVCVAEEPASP